MKDYYAALEVGRDSDVVLIRESYRRLIRQNYKDPKVFRQLNEAFTVLGDPGKRAEYDKKEKESDDGTTEELQMTNEPTHAQEPIICPMGAGANCPVVAGRVPLGDQFCPECGVELAQVASMSSEPAASAAGPVAWLEEDTGRHHPLQPGANPVGRETGAVVLQDKTVSREHARISVNPDGTITVEDLASTNGTKINGERLTPHFPRPINDMDSLTFGSILARLRLASADPKPLEFNDEAAVPGLVSAPTTTEEDPISRMLTNFDVEEQKPSAHVTGAKLISIRGDKVEEYPLVPGVMTFGRFAANTIVIENDPYVSGHHAQIIVENGTYRFTDVGSTNGSRLNGEKVAVNEPLTLNNGDEIAIGGSIFRLETA